MFGSNNPFGTAAFGASYSNNTSTPYGQARPAFGSYNIPGTGLFAQTSSTGPGLLGSTGFSSTSTTSGTTIKFNPPCGTDTMINMTTNVGTRYQCITCMKQYENKSLEELRVEDYAANRTGNSSAGVSAGMGLGTTTQQPGGVFRFSTAAPTSGISLFGTKQSTPMLGTTGNTKGFSSTSTTSGTTIKFNPPCGTGTIINKKTGMTTNVGTRYQCITCMKQYESKSLEELRMEDYAANRTGNSSAGVSTGMGLGTTTQQPGTGFRSTAVAPTFGFSFGRTTQSTPMFGTTGNTNPFGSSGMLFMQPAQNQNARLFCTSVGFGAPTASSAAPVFDFGSSTGTSLFGQNNQQQPLFGQTTGSTGTFGNVARIQGFGAANQQLSSQNKPVSTRYYMERFWTTYLFGQNNQQRVSHSPPEPYAPSRSSSFENELPTPGSPADTPPPSPIPERTFWFKAECVICYDSPTAVVFLPCDHICCCPKCSTTVTKCPMCRKTILSKAPLIISE